MSTDERVTKDLVETLEDGRKGFAAAAEKLADTTRSDLTPKFTSWSDQRARFAADLTGMAAAYGDDIDESGSVAGTFHRGWLAMKDALAGSDPEGVLDAAAQGEDHAVSEFEKALNEDDVSIALRQKIEDQLGQIRSVRDEVRTLQKIHD